MPERPPGASQERQNRFAKSMHQRTFSTPVSLCFPPGSQHSFSCHQNCVVLLTRIILFIRPQHKYRIHFHKGFSSIRGLFLAASAISGTACHARCRDGASSKSSTMHFMRTSPLPRYYPLSSRRVGRCSGISSWLVPLHYSCWRSSSGTGADRCYTRRCPWT